MIETIASVGLPVGEVLRIQKKRIWPEHTASKLKRISIVTGIHGDQLVDGKVFFIHNEPLTYANTAVIKLVQ